MKSRFLLLWLVLLAAFNFLFWSEAPGLNMLLFAVLVMTALFIRHPKAWRRKTVQISGTGTLICGIMVTVYGAGWSVFALIFSLCVFSVFVMEPLFRTVGSAAIQFVLNLFLWPLNKANADQATPTENSSRKKTMRIILLPLLVTFLFFLLYAWGNPHFAELFKGFFDALGKFFKEFSGAHFFFLVGGGFLCVAFLKYYPVGLERYESSPEGMVRKKRKSVFPSGMMALRRELHTGIVMLILLNTLLLFVNGLDISRVWNHFIVPDNFSLKKFVHEGTWVLMFSIFLSMLVLLWLFRGNIHFYKKNEWLKRLSYIWIAQNIFLAFSLFKRNAEYIGFHGLAYGRIVVIVFLMLVVFGLITFIIKIRKDRSLFFLQRINSWAVYVLIVFVSFINWDRFIVNYNIHHSNPGQIDIDYYLKLHNNVLPLLYENAPAIKLQMEAHKRNPVTWVYLLDIKQFRIALDERTRAYIVARSEKSWMSWNLADADAYSTLKFIPSLK
ncbi:hypothetical protein BH09BAC5_BH09BAC5_17350 [soil metagenome]